MYFEYKTKMKTVTRIQPCTTYILLWYGVGRPAITSEIGNLFVFVLLGWSFVFGIIMKRDGREPTSSDAITTLGITKLLLSYVF